MKTKQKLAFSLIEMLVVIAIIGVLAGVLLSQFGGATDSARATQCQTNLRNLAVAAQNVAMKDTDGNYPAAGSYKYSHVIRGKLRYPERKGWISWDLKKNNDQSKSVGNSIPFNSGDDELLRFAITNGTLWRATGESLKTYQCPIHAEACLKANGRNPGWSYVMNQAFGFDAEYGGITSWNGQSLSGLSIANKNGKSYSRPPDKVLLFAELQGLTIADKRANVNITPNLSASGTDADPTLQCIDKTECIGFNHKMPHGRYAGHVAFADGHVEKLMHPSSGISIQTLTYKLCQGHELTFDGRQYIDTQASEN